MQSEEKPEYWSPVNEALKQAKLVYGKKISEPQWPHRRGKITQEKYEGCFWGDGTVLYVIWGVTTRVCTISKLITWDVCIFLHVNYASIKKKTHKHRCEQVPYGKGKAIPSPTEEPKKRQSENAGNFEVGRKEAAKNSP